MEIIWKPVCEWVPKMSNGWDSAAHGVRELRCAKSLQLQYFAGKRMIYPVPSLKRIIYPVEWNKNYIPYFKIPWLLNYCAHHNISNKLRLLIQRHRPYPWGRREVLELWPYSPQVPQRPGATNEGIPKPLYSPLARRWGRQASSFWNRSFFGLPRGIRVTRGWHRSDLVDLRPPISIRGISP